MSRGSGTELLVDILCRVPPLLVLDKILCFQFEDGPFENPRDTILILLLLTALAAAMVVLFCLPIQQLQEAYSYLLSLGLLVLCHVWSTKIIAPGSTTFTLNLNYNSSGRRHPLADATSVLLASAVVQISLAQLFIALRTSRPSYQQVENNNRMALVVQLLLYLSFTLPVTHAVLRRVLPDSIPLTLLLSSLLPFLLLVSDWVQGFFYWVMDLPRVLKSEIALFQVVGITDYVSNHWTRLHVPNVLRTMFVVRLLWLVAGFVRVSVHHHFLKTSSIDFYESWEVNWELLYHLLAGSCETWVALLGFSSMLALLTSYLGVVVAWLLDADQEEERNIGTVSSVLFFILALQTGLTGLDTTKRLVRLYRNFCLLSTAILHFVHSTVNPLLMNVSASHSGVLSKHLRLLAMCVVLITFPAWMMFYLWQQHEPSTWLFAVSAFCIEIIIKVLISLTVYTLFMIDAYKETFWEKLDDYVYYVQSFGNTIEFFFGIFLFCNGAWIMMFESGGFIRALMMCIHAYFNIWCQAKDGWKVFINRRHAVARIAALEVASKEQLQAHSDVCAICYQDLKTACITKCRHYFHAVCLRKWLYVQDKCPLCHKIICEAPGSDGSEGTGEGDNDNGDVGGPANNGEIWQQQQWQEAMHHPRQEHQAGGDNRFDVDNFPRQRQRNPMR
ncbi:protein TRC8 homolog [Littorina saxatilis]|uniref:RING-type domain-containing protein n=1 Tax=Littorina saxatilis TaxID=31220 RepID=A0AAN9GKN0_9CAEN